MSRIILDNPYIYDDETSINSILLKYFTFDTSVQPPRPDSGYIIRNSDCPENTPEADITPALISCFRDLTEIYFRHHIVNVRGAIEYLWHNCYDIKSIDPTFNNRISGYKKKISLSNTTFGFDNIEYGSKSVKYGNKQIKLNNLNLSCSQSDSIAIRNYLESQISQSKNYVLLRSTKENHYKKYYIPVNHLPCFYADFIYNDARDYYSNDKIIEPKRKPRTGSNFSQQSFESYRMVFRSIKYLYNWTSSIIINRNDSHIPLKYPSSDRFPYVVSQLFRLEKQFFFLRCAILINYFSKYTNNEFIDFIISNTSLKYTDILNLKEIISNNIFHDDEFIQTGIKSSYFDFFNVFDCLFKRTLTLSSIVSPDKDLVRLKTIITHCKNECKKKYSFEINPADYHYIENGYNNYPIFNINECIHHQSKHIVSLFDIDIFKILERSLIGNSNDDKDLHKYYEYLFGIIKPYIDNSSGKF